MQETNEKLDSLREEIEENRARERKRRLEGLKEEVGKVSKWKEEWEERWKWEMSEVIKKLCKLEQEQTKKKKGMKEELMGLERRKERRSKKQEYCGEGVKDREKG